MTDWMKAYEAYAPQDPKVLLQTAGDKYMEYGEFFKARLEVTKAYSEAAKNFIQLSSAALALPLVFTQTILGKDVADKGLHGLDRLSSCLLVAAWLSFLITILSGVLYQWLVTRRAWDDLHNKNIVHKARYENLFELWPKSAALKKPDRSIFYFLMIFFFCVGAMSFVFYAAHTMGLLFPG